MIRLLAFLLLSAFIAGAEVTYKIRLTTSEGDRIIELPAEKYVAAVLAGESSVFRSEEAQKAMAVAARSYAARLRGRHASERFDFCATTHCQRVNLEGITGQLLRAAEATAGQILWFEGKPAFSVYTRDCGGETENAVAVWPEIQAPYLIAREDPYCTRHGVAKWSWTARSNQIEAALHQAALLAPDSLQSITILNRTGSNRARTLMLEGKSTHVPISAGSFRFAMGRSLGWNTLRSDRYEVRSESAQFHFEGRGEGHGIGLCQHGADEMGLEGFSFREILAFYYPGTTLGLTGAGLLWSRMSGEMVTLCTIHPDHDAQLLALAENLIPTAEARLHVEATRQIEIRVYPDIDTFRNAIGEPGWIAARTSGSRIDLQPAELLQRRGILKQTLRHEIFHVLTENAAAPGLPVWFREGLVEWMTQRVSERAVPVQTPDDTDLRQRADRSRAERASRAAALRVSALMSRYGEETVLGWLKRGRPVEVTNSSTSNAATKSR